MINAAKGAMVPHDPMGGFDDGADMPGEPTKDTSDPSHLASLSLKKEDLT